MSHGGAEKRFGPFVWQPQTRNVESENTSLTAIAPGPILSVQTGSSKMVMPLCSEVEGNSARSFIRHQIC